MNLFRRDTRKLPSEPDATAEAPAPAEVSADAFRPDEALNARLLGAHLGQDGEKRLQLGTGMNLLPGWLNSDFRHNNADTFALDVTRPFPLPDAAFDFVFCEHMIEHITLAEARGMLAECRRVLKPGGVLRVATPSLGFLVRLMGTDRSDLEERYLQWAWENFGGEGPANVAVVVNGFVRNWGHQFIYDHATLREAMRTAGFARVAERRFQESPYPALRGLEFARRMPPGFLELESMIYEGEVDASDAAGAPAG